MSEPLENVLRALEMLKQEDRDNAEAYEMLEDLLEIQAAIEKAVQARIGGSRSRYLSALEKVYSSKEPLVSVAGFPQFPEEVWREIALSILAVLRRHRPSLERQVRRLEGFVENGSLKVSGLVASLLRGRSDDIRKLAEKLGLEPGLIEAVMLWSLQPVVRAVAGLVREHLKYELWGQGYCPVCGSHTRIGYVEGEGRKLYLKCQVCWTEWRFSRLRCPFCGNEDHEKMGFYTLGGDQRFRLYVCHACGNYWKVVDETIAGKKVPRSLYEYWTQHLDHLANSVAARDEGSSAE